MSQIQTRLGCEDALGRSDRHRPVPARAYRPNAICRSDQLHIPHDGAMHMQLWSTVLATATLLPDR